MYLSPCASIVFISKAHEKIQTHNSEKRYHKPITLSYELNKTIK